MLIIHAHAETVDSLDGLRDVGLFEGLNVNVALQSVHRQHRRDLERFRGVSEGDAFPHQQQHRRPLLSNPTLDHPQIRILHVGQEGLLSDVFGSLTVVQCAISRRRFRVLISGGKNRKIQK